MFGDKFISDKDFPKELLGFALLFKVRSWTPFYQSVYVVFVGHALNGLIIDTDHWRHLYLIYGIIWGCIILYERERSAAVPGGRVLAPA